MYGATIVIYNPTKYKIEHKLNVYYCICIDNRWKQTKYSKLNVKFNSYY